MKKIKLKPIRIEEDYSQALNILGEMFDNQPKTNTPEFDYMEILTILVENYENLHYQISPPDPVEAIKFIMEQLGIKAKDLTPAIGKLNRVYEILNRKRKLTIPMIKKLHTQFDIHLESLL